MLKPKDYRPGLDGQNVVEHERRVRLRALQSVQDDTRFPATFPPSNKEEQVFANELPTSFTKGLRHNLMGTVAPVDYERLVKALGTVPEIGAIKGFDVPLDATLDPPTSGATRRFFHDSRDPKDGVVKPPKWRKWESPLGGLMADLQGPAPAGVAQPPAPPLGSSELTAELAEVYAMALLRDVSFKDLESGTTTITVGTETVTVQQIVDQLKALPWFDLSKSAVSFDPGSFMPRSLNAQERRRRAARFGEGPQELTVENLFRGSSRGAQTGPYVSQFMLLGNKVAGRSPTDGYIAFGGQVIDQRLFPDEPGLDYMTEYLEWLDVQNGAGFANVDALPTPQFLTTPRDMATYVHRDQLYQAYFNAALIMAGQGLSPDQGFPNSAAHDAHREGFATWGVPHLLALLAEVSSRALRAVRRQKFQIHRRSRPESLAARFTLYANNHGQGQADPLFERMKQELNAHAPDLLRWVALRNADNNGAAPAVRGLAQAMTPPAGALPSITDNYLLPMAFGEGSPMHPAYGAGHATVAGACVTVLKAFFDTVDSSGNPVPWNELGLPGDRVGQGASLGASSQGPAQTITGELDKLAANISIGRNMGGVHYYTDYYESLRMGERIATMILYQNMFTSAEKTKLRFHDFDGRLVTVYNRLSPEARPLDAIRSDAEITVWDPAIQEVIPTPDWWTENLRAALEDQNAALGLV